ncbi:MAG: ATP-dependent RNA helicase HrpA [Burkholderiaceae bacterium]|nr:ATP-dependent RNA helicase HrpA [Burkholderiaceae bacterium]
MTTRVVSSTSGGAPTIEFPPDLPVCAHKAEIEAALRQHQVIIVCGETGSGKTTQLPKIALAMGRGKCNAPPLARGHLIGHTQPRRIAASSVARRIAEELRTPLGDVVGYKVRFQDRLSKDASIKLMTDGILLAETQTDPLLAAYDTLIIDEAHERSLNIDFLLGYLRQLLPRRPDLKLIITSATIDADRFARHFQSAQGPAPVLMVSGRTYPVEQRWRPFEESREYDLNRAIADAVDELWTGSGDGDILVFLPGEREIRDAADHLHQHLARSPLTRAAQVLPLFARLSQAEQDRIFEPHPGTRRIVLATNVAETSLTVPGIHCVIDAGTARVKRYSYRSKVEQLLIEPISQAAANQRAGRCGRVAGGICIRLYDEKDFAARPPFTDPEILRSSLAGVILRMKSLHLLPARARVEDFAFLQAPSSRAIADGYQLLAELGAVDDAGELTALGQELARLPLDPRMGRMLLEARARGALSEALIVASALSVQDVRDRPLGNEAQADQQHAKFDDEKSEFSGYLRLWKWLHNARGGGHAPATRREMLAAQNDAPGQPPQSVTSASNAARRLRKPANMAALPVAQRIALAAAQQAQRPSGAPPDQSQTAAAPPPPTHKLSNRQYEQLLRQNFINPRRLREWRDIHTQLRTIVAEHRWRENTQPASYEALHQSLLAGLLGNVGCKIEADSGHKPGGGGSAGSGSGGEYLGARGIKFFRHPGAHLSRKPGRWIMCAELVETTRLFGRGIASIEPQWLEEAASHLIKKQLLDPHWEKKAGEVVALERATLYGLPIYNGRRKRYALADPRAAREIFIRQALVAGDWDSKLPFLAANRKLVAQVQDLEHKSRRQDVLVDDELIYAFYDQHIPPDICGAQELQDWYRQAAASQPRLLMLSREELMRHQAAGITTQAFPGIIRMGGVDCTASYLHAPGDACDGLTVTVPLFVLNQISEARSQWLVPGMLKEKIQALLKSLPQKPRARFVPLPENATRLAQTLSAPDSFGQGSLIDALLARARQETGLDIQRADFKLDMLPAHLFMNFRIVDEHGRQLGQSRNLAALKAELGGQARGAFQILAALKTGTPQTPDNDGNAPAARQNANAPAAAAVTGAQPQPAAPSAPTDAALATQSLPGEARYTTWSFGALPELMQISRKGQTLVGFPALVDDGEAVRIEVFDEPELAATQHRAGLRRLLALQIRDALKYLEKNIPDLQKMAVAYIHLGTAEELRAQIIDLALERAFLQEQPLPHDAATFAQRLQQGRARLTLIAHEIARLAASILTEYAQAVRKLKDTKTATTAAADAVADAQQQLHKLIGKRFLLDTPWQALQHLARYLKAIQMRMDKLRADPERDARHTRDMRAQEQRFWRLLSERKGAMDNRMQEMRWLLEELRVSLFAQELRTPQPVSIKRLEKIWAQLNQ